MQDTRNIFFGTWGDRFLLLMALAGIALLWQYIHVLAGDHRPMVSIYHDQTLLAQYPLHGRKTVHFDAVGELGVSEITIENGQVYFFSSPCTSQRCVLSGHQHHIGDVIACVPNHILVSIRGDAHQLDAVVE